MILLIIALILISGCQLNPVIPTESIEYMEVVKPYHIRGAMKSYGIPEDVVDDIEFDHLEYWLPSYHQIVNAVEFVEPIRNVGAIDKWRECTDRGGGAMYAIRLAYAPGMAVATIKYWYSYPYGHKGLLFFYRPTWDNSMHVLQASLVHKPGHPEYLVELDTSRMVLIEGIEM